MGRLNVARIKALREPGKYGDGGGLYLRVTPSGSRQWIQRIVINRRRRDCGLGGWPLTSLAEARDKAFANRKLARDGGDPLAEKHKATTPTFREAAAKTFEASKGRWRNAKTTRNWIQQLELHAFPVIGDKPVNAIGREDVLRILTRIWTATPETARKTRSRIRSVLAWAMANGFTETNPAGEMIDAALPSQPSIKAHYKSVAYPAVGAALRAVRGSGAGETVTAAIEFMVLNAVRGGEVRGAKWSEVDLDTATWTISASRMKTRQEHRVPLSDAALAVLERVQTLRGESGLVFPSQRDKELSNGTLGKCLRTAGVDCVPHGFRSSFRTWASERTSVPHAVAETALAHHVGSAVERSYARSDLFEKRRRLMDQWAAFLTDSAPAKVVSFTNRRDNN